MYISIRLWFFVSVLVTCTTCNPAHADSIDLSNTFSPSNLMPQGHYYEATVPDTLDLAERARAAVQGLTRFLNEKKDYSPYGHAFYNVQQPYMTTLFTGPDPCWSKILDAMLLTRLMSGSDRNIDIQSKSFQGIVSKEKDMYQNITDSRFLLVLMTLYEQFPDPLLEEAVHSYARGLQDSLVIDGDHAYFKGWGPEKGPDMKNAKYGVIGYGWQVFVQGTLLRALSRYAARFEDAGVIDTCRQLKNYVIQPAHWFPEFGPKAVTGAEHGRFMGHHHSYAAAMMGLLWYAEAANDMRVRQFVRDAYEYMRTFGIARIGLFAEMCTAADMTFLAIKMSNLGVGDYWDDADQYLRNQIAETQILDTKKLRKAARAEPILARLNPHAKEDIIQPITTHNLKRYDLNEHEETEDDVIERTYGCYLSCASHPTHIPKHQFLWTICCSGNVPPALYATWDAAARFQDGVAQVNLLFNCAAPWLDVDSYLPYEGKVVIRNKKARKLSVRIPGWAAKSTIRSLLNGKIASPFWLGRYLVFDDLDLNDVVTITFPMVETTETYTLKWKKEDFWFEGTNPGTDWKPPADPDRFTFRIKGNTVIEVTPAYTGGEYALYERDHFRQNRAPMKKVTRFVTPTRVRW